MSWDGVRSALSEKRPVTAIIAAIGVAGAGVSAVLNGADVMDLINGKGKAEQTAIVQAQERESEALKTAASTEKLAAERNELAAWATALELNTADGFSFYLRTYPEGTHRAEAEVALTSASQRPRNAFRAEQLHPTVAIAVATARQAANDASAKKLEAEAVARRAAAAALQAQGRTPPRGYISFRNAEKDLYEGEGASGRAEGVGVYIEGDAPNAGDKYQGQLSAGRWNGLGVYESVAATAAKPARYAGEFQNGRFSGSGVAMRADSASQAGIFLDGGLNGPGVETRSDGSLLEGEFRNGAAHGLAVLWSPSGAIIEAGRYENGVLVQPF